LSDRGGTLAQALFGFFIQFLRMRGGVAQWGYVPNDDSPLVRAAPNVQFIADANNAARFCAVFVNFNLATTDRVRGQGACFEESVLPTTTCRA